MKCETDKKKQQEIKKNRQKNYSKLDEDLSSFL